ncbi:Reverse transcriptase (RNA-dependent DNA polymerase) [Fragilaria crotonensis]|nr:Reverse transcriptase (RNA-dependent DNA polymerase) [Fragilaria crotonensis]
MHYTVTHSILTPANWLSIANSASAAKVLYGKAPTRMKSVDLPKDTAIKRHQHYVFINVSDIPKGRKATYLRVVSAMRPEKAHGACVGPSVAIASIIPTSAPKPPTSPPPNSSSTAPSRRPMRYMTADLKDFYLGTPCPASIAHQTRTFSPPWQKPNYGAKTQFAIVPDDATALDATDKRRILEVLGTLLFYARAIDSTLLTAIGELATEQSEGTKTTMEKLSQLLNYCATHPNATVRFTASDMILAVESDASYLSVVKARSRAAGYFYLTTAPVTSTAALKPNGAVHVLCHIMREVLSSAAEAELGALFHNGKEACPSALLLKKWAIPSLQPHGYRQQYCQRHCY